MITEKTRKPRSLRIEVPAAPASTSRNVNRYVEAAVRCEALSRAALAARADARLAYSALTGAQSSEANHILTAAGVRP